MGNATAGYNPQGPNTLNPMPRSPGVLVREQVHVESPYEKEPDMDMDDNMRSVKKKKRLKKLPPQPVQGKGQKISKMPGAPFKRANPMDEMLGGKNS